MPGTVLLLRAYIAEHDRVVQVYAGVDEEHLQAAGQMRLRAYEWDAVSDLLAHLDGGYRLRVYVEQPYQSAQRVDGEHD
jgi:hypothetical protein